MNESASSGPIPIPAAQAEKVPPQIARMRGKFAEINRQAKVVRDEMNTPPLGWWKFHDDGSLAGVLKSLEAATIPDHAKAFLKAEILDRCTGDLNFVHVNAHRHIEGGHGVGHFDIKASKKTL